MAYRLSLQHDGSGRYGANEPRIGGSGVFVRRLFRHETCHDTSHGEIRLAVRGYFIRRANRRVGGSAPSPKISHIDDNIYDNENDIIIGSALPI